MIQRLLACSALLVLIVGCAPSLSWHKEGADPEELRRAREICAREAESYGFALERDRGGDELVGGERRAGSASGGVYRNCMERQGWRRYRDQPRV
jgi:hypothetical protein